MSKPIRVIFRKWLLDGSIDAYFPDDRELQNDQYCKAYSSGCGEHEAYYSRCINNTVSASKDEYQELKEELESKGYKLKILE